MTYLTLRKLDQPTADVRSTYGPTSVSLHVTAAPPRATATAILSRAPGTRSFTVTALNAETLNGFLKPVADFAERKTAALTVLKPLSPCMSQGDDASGPDTAIA